MQAACTALSLASSSLVSGDERARAAEWTGRGSKRMPWGEASGSGVERIEEAHRAARGARAARARDRGLVQTVRINSDSRDPVFGATFCGGANRLVLVFDQFVLERPQNWVHFWA